MRLQNVSLLLLPLFSTSAFATDWISFQDPFEQAFTMDVPKDWTVKGGLFRLGYSDTRLMVDVTSPDREINVRLGDVAIPSYELPSANHPREGEIYDLGAQAQLIVASYRSGAQYAALYGQSRFRSVCPKLTTAPVEWVAPFMRDYIEDSAHSTKGEAAYQCGIQSAYIFAKTSMYSEGLWQVHTLGSFIAHQDQLPIARAVLMRMSQSFHLSPRWVEYQKKMDRDALVYQKARQQARMRNLSAQAAQLELKMQGMQNQVNAYLHKQAGQQAQVTAIGNLLTGVTPTVDPLGNPHNVWTGPKSGYWTNGKGEVVNADLSPGAGWQPLKAQP
jgi:hypothetical protein